jgi:cobalt-precorrin-5B (C1)-methyltransferase
MREDRPIGGTPGMLRTGYTTGACAAAAARAAWECLIGKADAGTVLIRFPDGHDRSMPVAGVRREDGTAAEGWVIKDAGDDPDVTHGAVVRSRVSACRPDGEQDADFIETCNAGKVVLRAGVGVGRVTRRGLEVPPGKWAINPVPRRMIAENLALAGLGADGGRWLVEIGIDGGAELAARTLNPILGIVDGLSILGTSGFVIPCSNQAYLATIRILLNGAREMDCATAVLATGGRTHRSARAIHPDLPEPAFVRIGDFIREAIEHAAGLGFDHIVVACMPGKLAKYAMGLACTHAHVAALSMEELARTLEDAGMASTVVQACRQNVSVRGFLEALESEAQRAVLERWAGQALDVWKTWAPPCQFELLLFENDGRRIGQWTC